MIRLEKVDKYFNRKKKNEIHVINDTSLELGDKGLVTFLGHSGCGKTTLLNTIGGLDKVNSGRIFIDDQEITRKSSNKIDEIRNRNIGYIFQNFNLMEDASVFDNVAIPLKMMGIKDKAEIQKRVMYILERVGMDRYKNRPAKMLSGGERQRVGIARALVKNPKIIIADEPTGNLDSSNTIEIMNIIKAISKYRLVILVTHEKDIAEFYASRIIEIVDGRVVNDRICDHDNELDYRMDNKVYLKDMPVHKEMVEGNTRIDFYSDSEIEQSIKVVIRNNNIYIETDESISAGSDAVELIDDHYQKISRDIYEQYEFNYDEMVGGQQGGKYTSIYNPVTLVKGGFKKVASYSVIKKILLLGFLMASMLSIYAISHLAGILTAEDSQFVTSNQNYVTVKTGKLNMKTYEKFGGFDGVDYELPGDSMVNFTLPLDDFYQTFQAFDTLTGSLSSSELIDEEALIAGKNVTKKKEIVVDKLVLDALFERGQTAMIGIRTYDQMVGRKVNIPDLGDFTIVGVTDQSSPSIYAKKNMLGDIVYSSPSEGSGDATYMDEIGENEQKEINKYKYVRTDEGFEIVSGTRPGNYQALIPENMKYDYAIGSLLKNKVNGRKLEVSGYYRCSDSRQTIYVNDSTAMMKFIGGKKDVTLCASDKAAVISAVQQSGAQAIDNYQRDKDEYLKQIEKEMIATCITAAIILFISLIEIYLMLRASFLSRIKEVGVLRAIGLKKRDIYKMFSGEIIAISCLTTLPGMAVMAYILYGVTKIPGIGENYMINPAVFFGSLALVFIFNMFAGLLPAIRTMRMTPAAILARNDVN